MTVNSREFLPERRERFLNQDTYQAFAAGRLGSIEFDQSLLMDEGPELDVDDGRHLDWRWGIASSRLQLLIGHYSAGEQVASITSEFPRVLADVEESALPRPYRTEPFYLDEIDTYAYAMWLLSLCKLLRLDPLLPRVIALFDVARDDNRGKDALFETLVARLGGQAVEVKPAGAVLKMLKAHPLLYQATQAEPAKRPLLVAEFLKKWYASMKGCYWHNRHDKAPQNFFGYWAFEAGLVTYLWDIDDKAYRDLPFYPKDLVDHARSHPELDTVALATAAPDSATMPEAPTRVPAGQPCPRTGYWMTPASAGSRRRFQAGDVMPDLRGAWGATIWQWDVKQSD